MERYLPIEKHADELLALMRECGVTFRDEINESVIGRVRDICGDETARLFERFIHIYDFKKEKLREIKQYAGTEKYDALACLLRLPGVRLLRAGLYFSSGVTLEALAQEPTEKIQSRVRDYVTREGRTEIVPLTKEVNCHKEVAKMILHASGK